MIILKFQTDRKITLIKILRDMLSCSLVEAKNAVENGLIISDVAQLAPVLRGIKGVWGQDTTCPLPVITIEPYERRNEPFQLPATTQIRF